MRPESVISAVHIQRPENLCQISLHASIAVVSAALAYQSLNISSHASSSSNNWQATSVSLKAQFSGVPGDAEPVITEYPVPTAESNPPFIAAGSDGALWFTEYSANDKIGRITTGGSITEYVNPTANSYPSAIAAGPDGALWFTEYSADKIGRITTGGSITEFTIPAANSYPGDIAAGPDGALWFTEFSGDNRPDHDRREHHRVPNPHGEQRSVRHRRWPGRRPVVHGILRLQDRPDHDRREHHRVRYSHGERHSVRHRCWPGRRPVVHGTRGCEVTALRTRDQSAR
jgi:streptogramin lyase